jgi:TolB-like protein
VDTGPQPSERRDATMAIAVLPFSGMSPAQDQEYFWDGMAEEVMNALVGIAGIRVAARTSAFRASRDGGDLPAIGDLLGVSQVLEGSVRSPTTGCCAAGNRGSRDRSVQWRSSAESGIVGLKLTVPCK